MVDKRARADAEVYYGDMLGQEKARFFLKELGLPRGLLHFKDILECGYVEETGFIWVKQKKRVDHFFEKVNHVVSFAADVTFYLDRTSGRVRNVTGIKTKEMMVWLPVKEMIINGPPTTGMLTFKSIGGIYRTFPMSVFAA